MANQQKLNSARIPKFRDELLRAQGGVCLLCGELINGDAVLDHDHRTESSTLDEA